MLTVSKVRTKAKEKRKRVTRTFHVVLVQQQRQRSVQKRCAALAKLFFFLIRLNAVLVAVAFKN